MRTADFHRSCTGSRRRSHGGAGSGRTLGCPSVAHRLARSLDREIWRLALPAFLALVAEPLFLLADAAIVGHLGTAALAGLGIAAVVLQTLVGLCVFLAYGTTASVARLLGAGDRRAALAQGIDGVWLAVVIGVRRHRGRAWRSTGPLVRLRRRPRWPSRRRRTCGSPSSASPRCWSCSPRPASCAACRTPAPRWSSRSAGNALNIVLNLLLVYGVGAGVDGLGIAGSALGSVLAQVASAAALLAVVVRGARREGARLRPDRPASGAAGPRRRRPRHPHPDAAGGAAAHDVRRGARRGRRAGDDQSVSSPPTSWRSRSGRFLAFALDAIAIAAQAITGRYLGAGDATGTRAVTAPDGPVGRRQRRRHRRRSRGGQPVPRPAVHQRPRGAATCSCRSCSSPRLGQPIAGVVFVLDGVLIGAGDGTLPRLGRPRRARGVRAGRAARRRPRRRAWSRSGRRSSALLMGARFVVLTLRARGDAWLVTGARSTDESGAERRVGTRMVTGRDRPPLRRRERHRTRLGRRRTPTRRRPALLAGDGARRRPAARRAAVRRLARRRLRVLHRRRGAEDAQPRGQPPGGAVDRRTARGRRLVQRQGHRRGGRAQRVTDEDALAGPGRRRGRRSTTGLALGGPRRPVLTS